MAGSTKEYLRSAGLVNDLFDYKDVTSSFVVQRMTNTYCSSFTCIGNKVSNGKLVNTTEGSRGVDVCPCCGNPNHLTHKSKTIKVRNK